MRTKPRMPNQGKQSQGERLEICKHDHPFVAFHVPKSKTGQGRAFGHRSRGESGWCSDVTSTHGAWRHAGVRFLLRRVVHLCCLGTHALCCATHALCCASEASTSAPQLCSRDPSVAVLALVGRSLSRGQLMRSETRGSCDQCM